MGIEQTQQLKKLSIVMQGAAIEQDKAGLPVANRQHENAQLNRRYYEIAEKIGNQGDNPTPKFFGDEPIQ